MKIIILFLLIISLSGCSSKDIVSESLYIASIGFEKEENIYTAYYLLPSSLDVGQQKNGSSESSVSKIQGDSIMEIFNHLKESSALHMNFKHISSMILHSSVLNDVDINEIVSYVIDTSEIDYNFHVFSTDESIEEIYKIKNPNDESMIMTVLVEPIYAEYSYYTAEPVHFLNFCRDLYNRKTIHMPYIELQSIWDEKDMISASGITFYDNNIFVSIPTKDNEYVLLKSREKMEYSREQHSVIFKDYKVRIKYDKPSISIKSNCTIVDESISIDDLAHNMESKIYEMIKQLSSVDFLNITYYGQDYNNIDIKIDLNIIE